MKIAVLVSLLFLGSFYSGYSQNSSPVSVAYQDDWMEPGENRMNEMPNVTDGPVGRIDYP